MYNFQASSEVHRTRQKITSICYQVKELITVVCPVKYVFADINCNVVARMKSDAYRFFDNIDSFMKILNKE